MPAQPRDRFTWNDSILPNHFRGCPCLAYTKPFIPLHSVAQSQYKRPIEIDTQASPCRPTTFVKDLYNHAKNQIPGSIGSAHLRVWFPDGRTDGFIGFWCIDCKYMQVLNILQPRPELEMNMKIPIQNITGPPPGGALLQTCNHSLFFPQFQGQEYAEYYMLEYQRLEHGPWIRYKNKQGTEVMWYFQINVIFLKLNYTCITSVWKCKSFINYLSGKHQERPIFEYLHVSDLLCKDVDFSFWFGADAA